MQMKDYYDRRHQPKHFEAGDKVLLRIGRGYNIPVNDAISRKLGQQYAGLFTDGRESAVWRTDWNSHRHGRFIP